MKITFFGAAEEVTGSRYLVENEHTKILVDCGLFQGTKEASGHNRDKFPVEPSTIDAVVLTHAHIDHSGYLPLLVKNGFKGKIYCSPATYELCSILLVDSGFLQEEAAKEVQNRGDVSRSKPLYTVQDAERSLHFFETIDYDRAVNLGASLTVTLIRSGHILGASFVVIADGHRTITFSGDLGRPDQLIMKDPPPLKQTDFLVLESTYGDRLHEQGDPIKMLAEVVSATVAKGGVLLIPAFAVGRAQTILYCLYQLQQENRIPNIPIFLDSPMAIKVTDLFCTFKDEHKLPIRVCENAFNVATHTRTVEESKQIDHVKGPSIIISASGMATGGRVVRHLKNFITDAKNTILFVGFQGEDTEGRSLVNEAKKITIYGKSYNVKAEIKTINAFSAHADYNEILKWLGHFEKGPKKLFLTHGEPRSAQSLKRKIEEQLGWSVLIPKYSESFDLE